MIFGTPRDAWMGWVSFKEYVEWYSASYKDLNRNNHLRHLGEMKKRLDGVIASYKPVDDGCAMTAEKLTLLTLIEVDKEVLQEMANGKHFANVPESLIDLRLVEWPLWIKPDGYHFYAITKLGRWVVENDFFDNLYEHTLSVLQVINAGRKEPYDPDWPSAAILTDEDYKLLTVVDGFYSVTHKGRLLLALLDGDFGDLNLDPEV